MKYVENNAGTMQGTYYNTEVAENDSRFMRGSKDQGSKLSISEVLARIEPSYIICIFFFPRCCSVSLELIQGFVHIGLI